MYNSPFKNKNIDKINGAGKSTVSNSMMVDPPDKSKKLPKTFDYNRLSPEKKSEFWSAAAKAMMDNPAVTSKGIKRHSAGMELQRRLDQGAFGKGVEGMSDASMTKYMKLTPRSVKHQFRTDQK